MSKQGTYRIAVRAMVEKDGKYLLLQRSKPARGEMGFWELPGGGQDFGESLNVALRRELMEETGLTVEVKEPLVVWDYKRSDNVQIIGMTFKCTTVDDGIKLSDEHISYKWLTIDQIRTMKIFPELLRELNLMKL